MGQRPSIREQLESSREELLDLSLRNRLVNFRPLKSRGVQVVDELPDQLHRILVLEGRAMSFLPREEGAAEAGSDLDLPQPELELESGLVAERHTDRFLQTVHSSHRLQYRLLSTFYAARTAIEELGVNLLFLALGMLEWYEDENSEILRRAPLILIPVQISRSDIQHRFRLEYTGEEIRTNLSLKLKLRRDFGVELPSVSEDEQSEIAVATYHDKVKEVVARMARWRIDGAGIFLGFFTFSRLVMYEDLDTEAWPDERKPQSHPLIEALLGEGFEETEPLLTDEDDLDRQLEPEQLHHVIEADSSQALALTDALGGRNLAIQGPPGTGKSQTITNLVAEAVAAQKRVLFVAEKRAALEVVKRNLDATGLGDACLEIHSHKSTKKAVLEDLQRTLRLGVPQQQDAPEHFRQLVRARDRLNGYCRAVNTPVGKSGVPPYRAYGELLRLGGRLDLDSPELPRVASAKVRTWPSEEYEERVARVRELQALIAAAGRPCDHAFWGSGRRVYLPERDRPRILAAAKESQAALGNLRQVGSQLANHLGADPPATMREAELLSRTARTASEAPDLEGIEVKDRAWLEHSSDIREVLETGARIARCHRRFDGVLVPTAWGHDVEETRATLAAVGPRWWRFMAPRFWRARRALAGLLLTENPPSSSSERLAILDAILEVQRLSPLLQRHQGRMQFLLGKRWHAQDSDWDALSTAADYLKRVHREIEAGSLSAGILEYLATANSAAAAAKRAAELDERLSHFQLDSQEAFEAVDLDLAARFPGQSSGDVAFGALTSLFERWQTEVDSLQEIVKFNLIIETLKADGLGDLAEIAARWPDAGSHLIDLLELARYSGVLEVAMEERPELAGFEGATHSQVVEQFRELDRRLLEINRARVTLAHFLGMPKKNAGGQVHVLLHEFAKKKRHKPIRRLIAEAGQAVQAIKPVFMMSPLSVAVFLPPASVEFDLVIFDEASQVRPVDALGALLRSRQAVVVGDEQQLPPTSFFDRLGDVDAEEDEDFEPVTRDIESILGLFAAKGAKSRMLQWHYRSRHDSLIAVSNQEFYDRQLVTFPSPLPRSDSLGLVFHHHPETVYVRGRGKSRNRQEARIVAEAAMRHARDERNRSLGIAAFSVAQRDAIRDELEVLRTQDPSCEEFFERLHPDEPFFIKNLETVQGDERDVIFISVGYGRDQNGHVWMQFGPLNHDGGERRLNVLITRAKYRCEVFSNITADDIDQQQTRARGVVALKAFLRYARDRELDLPTMSGRPPDSVFEENVAAELLRTGYEVDPQVGSGGFFIDLAVRDPERPGRYLLGIECDGATYHSARWARDRDRLRQLVLERLGWRIHRIWSTDWYRNPQREIDRLLTAIEQARVQGPPAMGQDSRRATPEASGGTIKRSIPREPAGKPMVAEPYRLAVLRVTISGELHAAPRHLLASWVEQVALVEGPVHIDEASSRIASATGAQRVGRRIRQAILGAARAAERRGKVRVVDGFLWPKAESPPRVRDRSRLPANSKRIERIAREELEEAILQVVRASFGIDAEGLYQQVARLLGFGRTSSRMAAQLSKVASRLEREGRLRREDSQYFVSN